MEKLLCGVDLGGTKIAIALLDRNGTVLRRSEIRDHRGRPEDRVIESIVAVIAEHAAALGGSLESLEGIGVGTSGHTNHLTGTVITNSNLPGFTNYPLGRKLQELSGVPVRVDNDANAQAYAEYTFGASRGYPNNTFVTVSTGIGAGIIIDGRLYRGVTGTSGEIGHTIIDPDSTIQCGCGNYGDLMALASGSTLPQAVHKKLGSVHTAIDFDLPDEQINGELIKMGYEQGDPLCTEIVNEYAKFLGIGLQNLFQMINPGLIVLGGGLTAWGNDYLSRVKDTFYTLAGTMMHERVEIKIAELGADAAVIGAAALLLEPV